MSRGGFLPVFTAILFGFSLGMLGVTVPLLAISDGYSTAEIGILVAVSALAQLITRIPIGALMRRFSEKDLITCSGVLIAVSCGLLSLSSLLVVFVLSQVIQGIARAFFWTAMQTQAVRVCRTSVTGLTIVNFSAGFGLFCGPALAGVISEQFSFVFALAVGTALGIAAAIVSTLLERLPTFQPRDRSAGRAARFVWRRRGVDIGCWMSLTSGGWKGLIESYVPAALTLAGQSAATVGFLVSLANVMVLAGTALAGAVRRLGPRYTLVLGVLATGSGIAVVGPAAGGTFVVAAALAFSGTGAGILQTVGPAIAADAAPQNETGDAIAAAGIFRSAALLVTPLGMAGLVIISPIASAFIISGIVLCAPAAVAARRP